MASIEDIFNDNELPVEERAIFAFLNVLDFCDVKHVHAANAFTIALLRKLDEKEKAKKMAEFNKIIMAK